MGKSDSNTAEARRGPSRRRAVARFLARWSMVGAIWTGVFALLFLAWCCSGVVAACAYRIAARASGREWIGLWTGVVFACYLSEMFITTTYSMASEPLFAACLAVYVLFLVRAADRPGLGIALAAGVMLGLTALSRPTVLRPMHEQ